MTQAVANMLEAVEHLSADERPELAHRILEGLASAPADVVESQIGEVRARINEVESGRVKLIPGEDALAQIRQLVKTARAAD